MEAGARQRERERSQGRPGRVEGGQGHDFGVAEGECEGGAGGEEGAVDGNEGKMEMKWF